MKLLTFLGASTAYDTTYVMSDGREHTAPFCGVALARFFPDTQMRVFVTPGARKLHLDHFMALVEDHVADVEPVFIGGDDDKEQLWDIFQAVVDHVEERERVVFDITHGFRSIAFLSFLAVSYLRVVKDIDLEAVLYGNFEARDKSVTPNRAPVIDLTSFVSLLDWMVAADRFVRFGDAHDLAEQLRRARPGYQEQQQDTGLRAMSQRISTAARAMDDVSLALRLIRPAQAMSASDRLQTELLDATQVIETLARPFVPLVQQVTDAYAPLAVSDSQQQADPISTLARERRMVHWYLERKQYVQAMAVAREWIISWAMVHAGMSGMLDMSSRDEVEKALGQANKQREKQHGAFDDYRFSNGATLRKVPQIAFALDLYGQVGLARNDLLHAGKRRGALEADLMEREVNRLCAALDKVGLPHDKSESVPGA